MVGDGLGRDRVVWPWASFKTAAFTAHSTQPEQGTSAGRKEVLQDTPARRGRTLGAAESNCSTCSLWIDEIFLRIV
jgi:hypothetical protein